MAQLSDIEIQEFHKFLGNFSAMANTCRQLQAENKSLKEQLKEFKAENNKLREQYNDLVGKIAGKL